MTALAEVRSATDPAMLTGTWRNTNPHTSGVVQVIAEELEGDVWMRFFGEVEGVRVDWGPARATLFSESNDPGMEQPFAVRWEHGFMTAVAHGFLRQGVLVILTFTRFEEGDPRASYFSKEFFFRE